MKKHTVLRFLSVLLLLCLLLPMAVACKDEELEENQIAVTWHLGMITSDLHEESPLTILDGEEGYSYSDIITIAEKGTRLTFVDDNGPEAADTEYATEEVFVLSHWVEENGTWVIHHPGDNYTGVDGRSGEIADIVRGEKVTYTYVTSYDNENIRLCYHSGQTEKDKPRKFPFAKVYAEVTYEEGTLLTSKSNAIKDIAVGEFLKTSKNEQWHEELKGLTMFAMGDSYFGGSSNGIQYVWPNLMAQKYDMAFKNYGIGGSTVASGGFEPMCERISKMALGTPDIILLEGGRNDFSSKSITVGNVTDQVTTTFCGGVNSCIDQLQAKYPNALIIGITCWKVTATNSLGETQQQYADAMKAVCQARGLPCFDASNVELCGVDMDRYSFREKYSQNTGDISHLNTAGMILAEPAFEKFIAEQYRAFLAAKQQ